MHPIKTPKKLIEVALPLDAINEAAAHEKMPGIGAHPRGIHLWWARRPLAAARAVIFAQMVNDPGYERHLGRGVNKEKADIERERLFAIIEDLVKWENTNNEEVLERARAEIRKSWRETCDLNRHHPQAADLFNPDKLPAFHDPFAGGGALPLEAQRLGLESYASDLNPVAVTINKAMIEIPPKFAGRPPVGPMPDLRGKASRELFGRAWRGAEGLAEDVRRYGGWMRDEAQRRIGHLYPKVMITADMARTRPDLAPLVGQELTVIAWLWARTVKSPNPAFRHVEVPLASTFVLSSKAGKEAYVEPVVEGDAYRFEVRVGVPPEGAKGGTTAGKRAAFICLLSGTPIDYGHIRAEGKAGRMKQRLMAIVAEGSRGRIYLSPTESHITIANSAAPDWIPEMELPNNPRDFKTPNYGLTRFGDLFTPRQLVALTTFSDLVHEAIERCRQDALRAGLADDGIGLDAGGTGALAYAQAVGVYLAFCIDKMSDLSNSLNRWEPVAQCPRQLFGRQAIPMIWDFAEGNPLGDSSGAWSVFIDGFFKAFTKSFENIGTNFKGHAAQANASTQKISIDKIISTDPPYYDNIGYADLSDFFYAWLRRSLQTTYPQLFSTVAVPKAEELVATPYRHGGKESAEHFFLDGMTMAMNVLSNLGHPTFPVTIYYAFKQSETSDSKGTSSTGWETFLEAVIEAGFSVVGTWPMRTENGSRMIGQGTNALASSIVLVCRKRPTDAPTISRRKFLQELNARLPEALADMTRGGVNSPVAPVDLSQAIIGPGMEVFSQYAAVLEADGSRMTVQTALRLINRFRSAMDIDVDTQFCLEWFSEYGWSTGKFGQAQVLCTSSGTTVNGLIEAGVVESSKGDLRLLRWAEMPTEWRPDNDARTPVWEALHQMIRALHHGSEAVAGELLARMHDKSDSIKTLAYCLYTLCERKGWADDARAYNALVTSWPQIETAAAQTGVAGSNLTLDL